MNGGGCSSGARLSDSDKVVLEGGFFLEPKNSHNYNQYLNFFEIPTFNLEIVSFHSFCILSSFHMPMSYVLPIFPNNSIKPNSKTTNLAWPLILPSPSTNPTFNLSSPLPSNHAYQPQLLTNECSFDDGGNQNFVYQKLDDSSRDCVFSSVGEIKDGFEPFLDPPSKISSSNLYYCL
ncbi:hypothetical protein ACH5RR_002838 [Cinchona calisaya]|uniref:Uncharacterized protein n=1 Tax=Cinchona calisaya TaxID=153742 RepID=A0ABD3AT41_9GENT